MKVRETFFPLGFKLISEAAQIVLNKRKHKPEDYFARHASCDWGDVSENRVAINYHGLERGGDLASVYQLPPDYEVTVITIGNRTLTRMDVGKLGSAK